jgi:uncharacterized membrane protein YqhA
VFEHLLKIRYIAVVVVGLAVLHALAFLVMGAKTAAKAYWQIWTGASGGAQVRPGLELMHSLDLLLLSLVLVILALGVAKLFLLRPNMSADARAALPDWLHIETFRDLKVLLWETILAVLLIISLSSLTAGLTTRLDWSALILPAAIFMLAMSLYAMKRS